MFLLSFQLWVACKPRKLRVRGIIYYLRNQYLEFSTDTFFRYIADHISALVIGRQTPQEIWYLLSQRWRKELTLACKAIWTSVSYITMIYCVDTYDGKTWPFSIEVNLHVKLDNERVIISGSNSMKYCCLYIYIYYIYIYIYIYILYHVNSCWLTHSPSAA